MTFRRSLACFIVFLVFAFALAAVGAFGEEATSPDKAVFKVVDFSLQIEGIVLEPALEKYLDLEKGLLLKGLGELEAYVEEKTRLLRNNRVFLMESLVSWELEKPGDSLEELEALGEAIPVRLIVEAKAGWSALALPFPKYNSDDGFSLALRYKDFNFLGTLEPLNLNFDYFFSSARMDLGASFGLLPHFLNANWAISVSGDISLVEKALSKPNFSTGISTAYYWDWAGLKWSIGPSLSYLYERDYLRHTASAGASFGTEFHAALDWSLSTSATYTMLHSSTVIASAAPTEEIQYSTTTTHTLVNALALGTGLKLCALPLTGVLSYNPSTNLFLQTDLAEGYLSDSGWTYSHSLSFNHVDWAGNFRQGAAFSLSNVFTWHFIAPLPTDLYDLDLAVDASLFASFHNLVGVNSRLMGRWFATWTFLGQTSDYDWEEYIRGWRSTLHGDVGLVVNLELPLNIAQGQFFGAELFDAEVLFSPFVDLALVRSDPSKALSDESNRIFCSGFEFVVCPSRARAFTYRLSVGYDLGDYVATRDYESSKLEITLGFGSHF